MSRRHHRTRLIATLTAVGASLGLAVGVALAFNPTLSNFEIEGDLTSGIFNGGGSAPTVTGVDWADGGPGFGALLNDGTDNPAEPGSASSRCGETAIVIGSATRHRTSEVSASVRPGFSRCRV